MKEGLFYSSNKDLYNEQDLWVNMEKEASILEKKLKDFSIVFTQDREVTYPIKVDLFEK